ncbi:hypothetical protein KIH27_02595 [Mycobacterium sp. M1]|uniref:Uncharacterized protein n=1 Tax=Mycolicibacter acidiphilus TaxID=2835306 RepID=A0ABS5RDV7_9MYCO|nr:hypothetical protein [Mycolicibacter acidiphilus]MBS9532472.1 hypothetical protein [Mycolicibacter acidiphilus]
MDNVGIADAVDHALDQVVEVAAEHRRDDLPGRRLHDAVPQCRQVHAHREVERGAQDVDEVLPHVFSGVEDRLAEAGEVAVEQRADDVPGITDLVGQHPACERKRVGPPDLAERHQVGPGVAEQVGIGRDQAAEGTDELHNRRGDGRARRCHQGV